MKRLAEVLDDPDNGLPRLVVEMGRIYLEHIASLTKRVDALEKQILTEANRDKTTRQLQTMPGVGPITAMAVTAVAPPMEIFRRGRDFAAWLGLVPRQHSTGGRSILGKTSKMGQRDIRRLLIVGAMSVVNAALRTGTPAGGWLGRMLERKPRMVAAIALANRMARRVWAMLTKDEDYRDPALVA
jgi:transposase